MVNRGEFLIPRLTREQYKRVIEGPIKVAGGQIAPRLLQRLLNDLGQQADQLPCLQHALMRTWDVWAAKGDSEALDLDDYPPFVRKVLGKQSPEELATGIAGIFTKRRLDEAALRELEELLIAGDLGPATAASVSSRGSSIAVMRRAS